MSIRVCVCVEAGVVVCVFVHFNKTVCLSFWVCVAFAPITATAGTRGRPRPHSRNAGNSLSNASHVITMLDAKRTVCCKTSYTYTLTQTR